MMPVSLHPGCVQDTMGTWSPTCLSKCSVTVGSYLGNFKSASADEHKLRVYWLSPWVDNQCLYDSLISYGLEVVSMSTDKYTIRTNLGDLRNTHITARTVVVKTEDKSEVPHVMIMVSQQMSAGGQSSMGQES